MGTVNKHQTWIRMDPSDNVAVALSELHSGTEIEEQTTGLSVKLLTDIPFGHKFALTTISRGSVIQKYGQVIGEATTEILAGDHVHVQNVVSRRGRGDLQDKESS